MFDWLAKKAVQAGLSIFLSPVEKVADAIARNQEAKTKAATDQERMKYELRGKQLEKRAEVLINEKPTQPSTWIRTWIGAVIATFLTKIYIGDKVLGQWTQWRTDPLSPELWSIAMIVITFYFAYETLTLWKK